jgi:hypothetical protein
MWKSRVNESNLLADVWREQSLVLLVHRAERVVGVHSGGCCPWIELQFAESSRQLRQLAMELFLGYRHYSSPGTTEQGSLITVLARQPYYLVWLGADTKSDDYFWIYLMTTVYRLVRQQIT